MKADLNSSKLILADGHVHIHNFFDTAQVLDAAWENFQRVAVREFRQENFTGILFLTEMEQHHKFEQLKHQLEGKKNLQFGNWIVEPTQESESLLAYQPETQKKTIVIAGHQIVTAENLEVLALITTHKVASGLSLDTTVKNVASAGGVPVLPWGVGKWIGSRGKIIQNFLTKCQSSMLCLGDNGGRPIFWQRPTYFKQAEAKGWRILPGSDPLPLASEFHRPGSFGFAIQGDISLETPGSDMKQILLNTQIAIAAYGSLENPVRFVRNQVAIRLA